MDDLTFLAILGVAYALYLGWCRWLEYLALKKEK